MKLRLILAAVLLLMLTGSAAWLGWALLAPYSAFGPEGVVLEIPRGTSRRGVSRLLERNGVVRSALAFELLARWRSDVELQAGEYRFDEAAPAVEVFRKIAEGRVFVHPLVIPEGLNMFEIAARVEQAGLAPAQEFLRVALDPSLVRDLAPQARSLEGFLFPATYGFPRSATAEGIAATMVARFRQVLAGFTEDGRNPHGLSLHEAVTLASLVEEETGQRDERPLIAGVFYNRLARRIALQCDPTVLYAMQLAGKNDGIIHLSDLRLKSPYNTYLHPGLPPGPISNPGQAALRAVLYPQPTEYLYFVADTEGGHFFSRTLAEHNANVAKYRRLAGLPPKPVASNGDPLRESGPSTSSQRRKR